MNGALIGRVFSAALLACAVDVSAKVFDIVVAKDGSGDYKTIADAIKAVPDNSSSRTLIFVKKGVYAERVTIGSAKKNVSLIGENADSAIIRYGYFAGKNDDGTVISGYQGTTVFTIQGPDLYAENITFHNSAGPRGVALAISTEADRTITRNCRFIGYQDTYRAHKYRQYHADCVVEGGVDYIYADGQVLFDRCTLRTVSPGSVIAAPGEARQKKTVSGKEVLLGFLFNECKVVAGTGVADRKVNLGRMWGPQYPAAVYSKCVLGTQVSDVGWATMSSGAENTSFVGEYDSRRSDGSAVDVSKRISWSRQISSELQKRIFNSDSFFVGSTGSWGTTAWHPKKTIVSLPAAEGMQYSNKALSWKAVSSAKGYLIYKNGIYAGMSESNSFSVTLSSGDEVGIKAVSSFGSTGVLATYKVGSTGVLRVDEAPRIDARLSHGLLVVDGVFGEGASIQISDLRGRILTEARLSKSGAIQVGKLSSGIYLVRVSRPGYSEQLIRLSHL